MEISRTKAQQPEQVQAAKRTEAIQREVIRKTADTEQQSAQKAQETEPKPVINGQGQRIGSRLNVSA
jgi:hypothetical protein